MGSDLRVIEYEQLKTSRDRALSFLESRQLPSGEFKMDYTLHEAIDPDTGLAEVRTDESPFSTSYIVHSLGFSAKPSARQMIARSMEYLRSQQLPGGLWRYWNRGTAPLGDIPTDVDDTSCISELLERFGGGAPDNKWILLLNRDSRGLFYTWLTPRLGPLINSRYRSVMLSDITFERLVLFWRRSPAKRKDVDAVVNANVALYFGPAPGSDPVVSYLLQIIAEGREDSCDKWYPHAITFYYALSRCYARGMTRLSAAIEPMLSRFCQQKTADGRIGENDMLTALAAGAILNFGIGSDLLEPAIRFLLETQQNDGGWSSQIFYTNGSRPAQTTWGSRELTTGFCLEVLERTMSTDVPA